LRSEIRGAKKKEQKTKYYNHPRVGMNNAMQPPPHSHNIKPLFFFLTKNLNFAPPPSDDADGLSDDFDFGDELDELDDDDGNGDAQGPDSSPGAAGGGGGGGGGMGAGCTEALCTALGVARETVAAAAAAVEAVRGADPETEEVIADAARTVRTIAEKVDAAWARLGGGRA
jgi:hypothetical protein